MEAPIRISPLVQSVQAQRTKKKLQKKPLKYRSPWVTHYLLLNMFSETVTVLFSFMEKKKELICDRDVFRFLLSAVLYYKCCDQGPNHTQTQAKTYLCHAVFSCRSTG